MKDLNIRLIRKATKGTILDANLVLLAIASALLASIGIYFGSSYLFLGSLLLSPFANPLLSTIYLFKAKHYRLVLTGCKVISVISVVMLVVGLIVFMMLKNEYKFPPSPSELIVTKEVIMLISLVVGMIGMFLWCRKSQADIIIGFLFSIALLQPLINISASLVFDDSIRLGANFMVITINLLGIIIGAWLVLVSKKLLGKVRCNRKKNL